MKCVHLDTHSSQLLRPCDGHILCLRPYIAKPFFYKTTFTNLAKFSTCFRIIVWTRSQLETGNSDPPVFNDFTAKMYIWSLLWSQSTSVGLVYGEIKVMLSSHKIWGDKNVLQVDFCNIKGWFWVGQSVNENRQSSWTNQKWNFIEETLYDMTTWKSGFPLSDGIFSIYHNSIFSVDPDELNTKLDDFFRMNRTLSGSTSTPRKE